MHGSASGRPIMALFDLVTRRWALRVVWELHSAATPMTFRALREACDAVSSSVLTRRLAELDEARVVERSIGGYRLTDDGRELVRSLRPLLGWSERWAAGFDDG